MPASLIRKYAAEDEERLIAVIADLVTLPDQLAERKNKLFREAALKNRSKELHEGRDEYHRIYDDYLGVAERFRALADTIGSPLVADFERVAGAVRQQRDMLFGRWKTHDDLCEILIETVPPSAAQLRALAGRSPPPQTWYDSTDDPFQPGT